jgi:quinol monooxygenase YgiN
MICAMATMRAKDGRLEALVRAAVDHGRALREQPGCVTTYVFVERDGTALTAVSLFRSEEELQRAIRETGPVLAGHHLETLTEGEGSFKLLESRE